MIHTFKSCGIHAAVDSRDGSVRLLDSLMYAMIPSLPPVTEMTKDLPTSIRYAFAKYDSQDLSRAYNELYDLYTSEKPETETEEFGKMPTLSVVLIVSLICIWAILAIYTIFKTIKKKIGRK